MSSSIQVLTDVSVAQFTQYNFGHDEWHNSTYQLKKFLWSKQSANSWSQPLGFGPVAKHTTSKIEYGYVRRSIKFKTSRTYLQTVFPSLAFSFATPGTVVEATYTVETVDKLNRLSGGYHSFGLSIHGVQ
jgi:hypothetical protein